MATKTELFRFSEQGVTAAWTFTSGDELVNYDAGSGLEEYTPVTIRRSDIETRNEMARANLDIKLSIANAAALKWLIDSGERIVSLSIFERDREGVWSVIWKGRLAGVVPGMNGITLKMESIFTSLRRPGLRARYQRSCRHPLYGRGCWVDPETKVVAGSVTAISGTVATIAEAAAYADGYFTGGMLRTADGVLTYIVNHAGNMIFLQRLSFALLTEIDGGYPFPVSIYPGCAHNRTECSGKFANILNYGGFDFIPKKNPMGGSSIV